MSKHRGYEGCGKGEPTCSDASSISEISCEKIGPDDETDESPVNVADVLLADARTKLLALESENADLRRRASLITRSKQPPCTGATEYDDLHSSFLNSVTSFDTARTASLSLFDDDLEYARNSLRLLRFPHSTSITESFDDGGKLDREYQDDVAPELAGMIEEQGSSYTCDCKCECVGSPCCCLPVYQNSVTVYPEHHHSGIFCPSTKKEYGLPTTCHATTLSGGAGNPPDIQAPTRETRPRPRRRVSLVLPDDAELDDEAATAHYAPQSCDSMRRKSILRGGSACSALSMASMLTEESITDDAKYALDSESRYCATVDCDGDEMQDAGESTQAFERRRSFQRSGSNLSRVGSSRRRGSTIRRSSVTRRRSVTRRGSVARRGSIAQRRRGSVPRRASWLSAGSSHTDRSSSPSEGKYALDSKSRYCVDDQDTLEANTTLSRRGSLVQDPSSRTIGSSTIVSSAADVNVFSQTVGLAMALAEEKEQSNIEYAKRESFRQFLLLSVNDDYFAEECVQQCGSGFLDSFRFLEANVLDSYTSLKATSREDEDFDLEALAPFCFPNGVRAKMFPRSLMQQAKSKGWIGAKADKHQVLVFTDGSGKASHGVAITVSVEIPSPTLVAHVDLCRRKRRCAVIISRWWRECYRRQKGTRRASLSSDGSDEVSCPVSSSEDPANEGARGKKKARRRNSANWLFNMASERRDSLSSRESTTTKRRGSLDWLFNKESPESKEKTEKKKKTGNKAGKKSSKAGGVADVLDHFLRSSPVPRYDPKTKQGVWCSAKLKVSKKKNQYTVIVRHAPFTAGEDELSCILEQLEGERERLIDMLKDATIPRRDSSKVIRATAVCFEVNNAIAPQAAIALVHETDQPNNGHVCPSVKKRASEAYQSMLSSENMGDVCVVEKCYVLMGGKPKELSLLFSGLKSIVDSEREDHQFGLLDPQTTHRNNEAFRKDYVRNNVLACLQTEGRLSPKQKEVCFPKSELEHVMGKKETFTLSLPLKKAASIELPLPLPQIAGQWGLATLLLRLGSQKLMELMTLILLERSVLLLGTSTEEVSSCACTLVELLKPYEWASTFLPLLPVNMLDFVNSPVPFVVGMAVQRSDEIISIEADDRVQEALEDGMSVLNLDSGSLSMELVPGEESLVDVPAGLRDTLQSLQSRIEGLAKQPDSALTSFCSFFQKGLNPRESVCLNSVRQSILRYMESLSGDLASDHSAWRRYGRFNELTCGFDFYPGLFLDPLRGHLQFMEEMTHTQLFVGYVNSKRKDDLLDVELQSGHLGASIAEWAWDKWTDKKVRRAAMQHEDQAKNKCTDKKVRRDVMQLEDQAKNSCHGGVA